MADRISPKNKYIGKYLDKKMKGHDLSYGIEWFNKVEKLIKKAEDKWDKLTKKSK